MAYIQNPAAKPYEFQEFPKHVTVDGVLHVCNDADEERQALETGHVFRDTDERERLMRIAAVNEMKIDRRWSLERIAKAIRDAGYDDTVDPAK